MVRKCGTSKCKVLAGGGEGSGKQLWPLELRKAQCSSYKEEADGAGGWMDSGKSPTSALVSPVSPGPGTDYAHHKG